MMLMIYFQRNHRINQQHKQKKIHLIHYLDHHQQLIILQQLHQIQNNYHHKMINYKDQNLFKMQQDQYQIGQPSMKWKNFFCEHIIAKNNLFVLYIIFFF
jgi:hypothetical protein